MSNFKMLTVAAVCAALLPVTACISSKPPVAVSKSTYSEIQQSEHQTLPADVTFLTLELAQDIALQNNPTFKTKYFAIVAARAQYYSAFTYYLPTVSASYTFDRTYNNVTRAGENESTYQKSALGLSASITVFDSFAREMNLLAAKHNWKQTEEAEQDARRLLLRNVAYAYNEVMLACAQIRIAESNMKFQRAQLEETELKYAVGATTLSDVLNFKTKYNSAENDLYSAQYSYTVAKYALAALMGLTEGIIPANVQFPDMPSSDGEMLADINTYLDSALSTRPDLKGIREAYETQKYNYYSTIAAFGPKLTFGYSLTYDDSYYHFYKQHTVDEYSTSHEDEWTSKWGLTVSWDLFQGGRRFLAMRAAQANLAAADYAAAATWQTVIEEVRTAYDKYLTSLKQVRLNQNNLEITRKMRDLVNEEYIVGSKGITRLNEAQNDLVNAQNTLASAVVNMHNAKAQLKAASNQQ